MNPLKQGPYSPDHCVCEVPDIWVTSLCNQETGAGAGPAPGFIVVVSFKMQHSNYVEYVFRKLEIMRMRKNNGELSHIQRYR